MLEENMGKLNVVQRNKLGVDTVNERIYSKSKGAGVIVLDNKTYLNLCSC